MPPQKRPTRPVQQTQEAAAGFDAPRWYGADGTLVSGRLEPGTPPQSADDVPMMPSGEVQPAAEEDAAVDSQARQPVE